MGGKKWFEPTEFQLEMAVGHRLKSAGYFFWKQPNGGYFDAKMTRFRKQLSPFARNGIPDYIWIFKGLFIGLELKTPTGRVSESQKDFHDDVSKKGQGFCFVIRSLQDLERVIKHVDASLSSFSSPLTSLTVEK
jgi:hypothetical protein